jgi:hypothetical protein
MLLHLSSVGRLGKEAGAEGGWLAEVEWREEGRGGERTQGRARVRRERGQNKVTREPRERSAPRDNR